MTTLFKKLDSHPGMAAPRARVLVLVRQDRRVDDSSRGGAGACVKPPPTAPAPWVAVWSSEENAYVYQNGATGCVLSQDWRIHWCSEQKACVYECALSGHTTWTDPTAVPGPWLLGWSSEANSFVYWNAATDRVLPPEWRVYWADYEGQKACAYQCVATRNVTWLDPTAAPSPWLLVWAASDEDAESDHGSKGAYVYWNPATGKLLESVSVWEPTEYEPECVRGWRRLWWSVSQQSFLWEHVASGLQTSVAPELVSRADGSCDAFRDQLVKGGVLAETVPMTVDALRPLFKKFVLDSHPDKHGGPPTDQIYLVDVFKKLIDLLKQQQWCDAEYCAPSEHGEVTCSSVDCPCEAVVEDGLMLAILDDVCMAETPSCDGAVSSGGGAKQGRVQTGRASLRSGPRRTQQRQNKRQRLDALAMEREATAGAANAGDAPVSSNGFVPVVFDGTFGSCAPLVVVPLWQTFAAADPLTGLGGPWTDVAGELLTRQRQLLVDEEDADVAASVRGEAVAPVGACDEVSEALSVVTCGTGLLCDRQEVRTRWADVEDEDEGVEGTPCVLFSASCMDVSIAEHAGVKPQLAALASSVVVRDDERVAIAAAAWHIFEVNWLRREEQICRWQRARSQLLWTWPTSCVLRTFLRAWCEAAFAVEARRTVAPSRDRELDELFVTTGSVPTWRLEWLALRNRWWCSERADRSRRVWQGVQLYKCFAAWTLVASRSAELVVPDEEGPRHAEERRCEDGVALSEIDLSLVYDILVDWGIEREADLLRLLRKVEACLLGRWFLCWHDVAIDATMPPLIDSETEPEVPPLSEPRAPQTVADDEGAMSSTSSSSGFMEYFDWDFGNANAVWASRASDEGVERPLPMARFELGYGGHYHWHVPVAAVGVVESGEATSSCHTDIEELPVGDYDGGDEGPEEGGADPGGNDDDDDDDDAPGGDGGHRGGRGPGGDGGDGDDGGNGSGDDGGDDGGASAEPQKRRSRGRRPWPRYAPRPPVHNQRLFKCADRVPRGLWGSLCGAQQKSLLRVLRGYGYCLRRGGDERRARREAELAARDRRYWEDQESAANTCTTFCRSEPVRSWMDVVFVVGPSEEASLDRPLACDTVDSARAVSVPQDPLVGRQTKVHGACTAVLPDIAWQMSCLEYGLEQRVDGRLACVDRAVVSGCPRSLLLGDGRALIAAFAELLFGTCAVACHEHPRERRHLVKKRGDVLLERSRGSSGTCLQAAVLDCCRGAMRRRMRMRFAVSCQGACGSGLDAGFAEARSFAAVGVGLLQECAYVWVLGRHPGATSLWHRFKLGDGEGRCIGMVAWMSQRRHAVRLFGGCVAEMLAQLPDGAPEDAPWWTSVVGAPKKQKKKGAPDKRLANLKQFAKRRVGTVLSDEEGVSDASADGAVCSGVEATPSLSSRPGYAEPVMTRSRARHASVDTVKEVVHPGSGSCGQTEVPGVRAVATRSQTRACAAASSTVTEPLSDTVEGHRLANAMQSDRPAADRAPAVPDVAEHLSDSGSSIRFSAPSEVLSPRESLSDRVQEPRPRSPAESSGLRFSASEGHNGESQAGSESSGVRFSAASEGHSDRSQGSDASEGGRWRFRKRGRRHLRAGAGADVIAEVTEEMSKEFGTLENTEKCRARTWGGGSGVQCPCRPLTGSEFCGRHGNDRWKAHGRVDEVMSVELYQKFIRCRERVPQGKAPAPRKHYYTRHHMWSAAVAVRGAGTNGLGPLENLEELTNEERRVALEKMSVSLAKHPDSRQQGGVVFVEQGEGPGKLGELEDTALASYNGKGGGRFWRWYQPGEFEMELTKLGTDVKRCSERECVEALRQTSARIREYSAEWKADLKQYAGPQCYPHLTDPARYLANSRYEQGIKRETRETRVAERRDATGLPAHIELPDSLTGCWLKCGKCGARRLVDRWCMASLGPNAYSEEVAEVKQPLRWKTWLGEARSRYDVWVQKRDRGVGSVDVREVVEDSDGDVWRIDVEPERSGASELGSDSGSDDGDELGLPDDISQVLGSYQQRQADGNYLSLEEQGLQRRLLDGGQRRGRRAKTASARSCFDCSMLITKERVDGAGEGEREWRWRPLRCLSAESCGDGTVGDADDYEALFERSWAVADFKHGDPVFVTSCAASGKGPGQKGWCARHGRVTRSAGSKVVLKLLAEQGDGGAAEIKAVHLSPAGGPWRVVLRARKGTDARLTAATRGRGRRVIRKLGQRWQAFHRQAG